MTNAVIERARSLPPFIEQQSSGQPIDSDALLRAGNYPEISALLRVLEHARFNKKTVDTIIDMCSQMQNLRTAILDFKQQADHVDALPNVRAQSKERFVYYLERYFLLIVFNEYLNSCVVAVEQSGSVPSKPFVTDMSFSDWLAQRAEIVSIQQTLLNQLSSIKH